ncbi:Indolepyruvate ferredoxin oxidoreductase OS=Stutzerimonas stutzeri OX=316 GN=CXK95_03490 PE=4 SV=1 [Stutzerimonas stutzeri]
MPEPQHPSLQRPWNVLIPGVGGSGVTTLGALLGMAAHLEGKGCTVLDQAGLAQKFGPVTTHVRIAARQSDIYAVRIAAGEADLLLGCDLVVAAGDESLTRLNELNSNAVVNSHEAGHRRVHPQPGRPGARRSHAPGDQRCGRRREDPLHRRHPPGHAAVGRQHRHQPVPARLRLSAGAAADPAEAIEKAIELNGVSAKLNLQAFRWGRRAVLEREAVEQLARPAELAEPVCKTLEEIVDWRVDFLTQYQNAGLARRYRQLGARARRRHGR